MEAAFALEHISIGFNGIPVLRDASFVLRQNEVHAIAGKNGAGKSTLMKVLTGVYKPDSGKITIAGKSGSKSSSKSSSLGSAADMLRQGVAMVYQDLSLIPSMTVTQNIFLSRHPYQRCGFLQDGKARKAVRQIFAEMGGIDFISPDALVSELSVGEAQLVEIAKALAGKPRIVVFDEPTAALSDIETAQLF
ncbi:MAG: ATP-binding cassette domain-containing protein, partial [Spirochaetota bacterium]